MSECEWTRCHCTPTLTSLLKKKMKLTRHYSSWSGENRNWITPEQAADMKLCKQNTNSIQGNNLRRRLRGPSNVWKNSTLKDISESHHRGHAMSVRERLGRSVWSSRTRTTATTRADEAPRGNRTLQEKGCTHYSTADVLLDSKDSRCHSAGLTVKKINKHSL